MDTTRGMYYHFAQSYGGVSVSTGPAPEAQLDPDTLENTRRLFAILEGQNPDTQQSLNEFMSFSDDIERTNLPKREDVHFVTWLIMVSKSYFPNNKNNPFQDLAISLAKSFMAKGGLKSNQFVDLFRNSPNLADLQTVLGAPQERSIKDRILGRG